jgi:hypothetical protein
VWCPSNSNLLLHPRNEEQNSMSFPLQNIKKSKY